MPINLLHFIPVFFFARRVLSRLPTKVLSHRSVVISHSVRAHSNSKKRLAETINAFVSSMHHRMWLWLREKHGKKREAANGWLAGWLVVPRACGENPRRSIKITMRQKAKPGTREKKTCAIVCLWCIGNLHSAHFIDRWRVCAPRIWTAADTLFICTLICCYSNGWLLGRATWRTAKLCKIEFDSVTNGMTMGSSIKIGRQRLFFRTLPIPGTRSATMNRVCQFVINFFGILTSRRSNEQRNVSNWPFDSRQTDIEIDSKTTNIRFDSCKNGCNIRSQKFAFKIAEFEKYLPEKWSRDLGQQLNYVLMDY